MSDLKSMYPHQIICIYKFSVIHRPSSLNVNYLAGRPGALQLPPLQQGKTLRKRGQVRVYHIHMCFFKHRLWTQLDSYFNKQYKQLLNQKLPGKHKYIFSKYAIVSKSLEKHCNICLLFFVLQWETCYSVIGASTRSMIQLYIKGTDCVQWW